MHYRVQILGTHFYPLSFAEDGRIFGVRTEGEGPQPRQVLAVHDDGAIRDLWPLPPNLWIHAANARGWLTGHSEDPHHAFLFADGVYTDLGTLYGHRSSGAAINDRGWVAGWTVAPGGGAETWQQGYRAILVADGRMIDLASDGDDFARARGINNLGEVVGVGTGEEGFLYRDGWLRRFATFAPHAINDRGDIAGVERRRPAVVRGYLSPPQDLGLPSDRIGLSHRINARGTVVGSDKRCDPPRPERDTGGHFVCRDDTYTPLHALFPAEEGWQQLVVPILDDNDRLAGTGVYKGERHAFLLTPEDESSRTVE
jgi:probable HAF family extracellular repeat protein